MKCIVCHTEMTAEFETIHGIFGSKLGSESPKIKRWECEPCREMDNTNISLLLKKCESIDSAYKFQRYKLWRMKFNELLYQYDKLRLPNGYSFP